MTRQEKINTEFQRQIDLQNSRIDKIDTKLDAFIEEMRDRDNQRVAEMAEIRTEIAGIRTEMKGFDKYFHNLTITAMVGVGAAVIGIGVMVVGLLIK